MTKPTGILQRFESPEGHFVRTLHAAGQNEVWFVARDVCQVLQLANVSQALSRIDDDDQRQEPLSVISNDPSDDLRKVNLINESGLYALVLGSRLPAARAFKRWVTSEVLPSIRRTGIYGTPVIDLPATYADALEELARTVRQLDAAEDRRRVAELESAAAHEERVQAVARAAMLEPKAAGYDAFLSQAGAYPLAVAAQMLGMGRQGLINLLGGWKVLIIRPGHSDHLRPYTEHIHEQRFVVRSADVAITHRDGQRDVITRGTTLVTPKGLDYIRARRLREDARAPRALAS